MAEDWLDDQEFYELMQAYRTAPLFPQRYVIECYEAVKAFIREKTRPYQEQTCCRTGCGRLGVERGADGANDPRWFCAAHWQEALREIEEQ